MTSPSVLLLVTSTCYKQFGKQPVSCCSCCPQFIFQEGGPAVALSLPQGRIAFRPTGRPLTYLSVNDCYYLRWQPVHPLWMMLGLIDCTAEIARELKERRCFHIVWRWEELLPAYLSWIYCCFRASCELGVSSKRR